MMKLEAFARPNFIIVSLLSFLPQIDYTVFISVGVMVYIDCAAVIHTIVLQG